MDINKLYVVAFAQYKQAKTARFKKVCKNLCWKLLAKKDMSRNERRK